MSRIGKLPITLPEKVEVQLDDDGVVSVKGPKGELNFSLPEGVALEQGDGGVELKRTGENRRHKALHGTARSLISNMVKGVSEGFVKQLEIQGVGYRAAVKGKALDLSLGFSHPVQHPIPDDLKVSVENNTEIKIEGIDKQRVGQFAAEIRAYRPPEPYKGKGVRYKDEYVRRKAGKSVQ